MSDKIQLTFKNEDDEAQWWYDNREALGEKMAAAMRDGRARPRTLADRIADANSTVRLNPEDVKVASELAKRRGIELQPYLEQIMHEAIERERSLVA